MFDLPRGDFPTTSDALRDALEASVRRRMKLPPGRAAVALEAGDWPAGRALRVDVTGGQIDVSGDPRQLQEDMRPPVIVGDRRPGPSFGDFAVVGEPFYAGEMACRLEAVGKDVRFDFGRDADGTPVMAPAEGSGTLLGSVPKNQFLEFIRQKAREGAAEKGVTLDRIDADVTAPDPRSLAIAGTLHGHKKLGIFNPSFTIDFAARVSVDDDLIGHVTQLDLRGHGVVMETLIGLIRPKLEQIKREPVAIREVLGAVVPAGLGMSSLKIEVDDEIRLSAAFGETR